MSWCELALTFDLAIVTPTVKIFPGQLSETVWCRKLIRNIYLGSVGVQCHGVILPY